MMLLKGKSIGIPVKRLLATDSFDILQKSEEHCSNTSNFKMLVDFCIVFLNTRVVYASLHNWTV